jgi:hypothetical protein
MTSPELRAAREAIVLEHMKSEIVCERVYFDHASIVSQLLGES